MSPHHAGEIVGVLLFLLEDALHHSTGGRVVVASQRTISEYISIAMRSATRSSRIMSISAAEERDYELRIGSALESSGAWAVDRPHSPHRDNEQMPSKQVHPAYLASRGGAAKDRGLANRDEWVRRFCVDVAARVDAWLAERAIDVLYLLGSDEQTSALRAELRAAPLQRLDDRGGSLSISAATPDEINHRIDRAVANRRDRRDRELVSRIREHGIRGVAPSVRAADVAGDGQRPERSQLGDVVFGLARRRGAQLWLLSGDPAEELTEVAGGIAGLRRW